MKKQTGIGIMSPYLPSQEQIRQIVDKVNAARGRASMAQWDTSDIRAAVEEVRADQGDTGQFLRDIAEENPTMRTIFGDYEDLMAAAQSTYNAAQQAVGPIVEGVEDACESEPDCGIPPL
jgi:hypothetical protein